jgi:hypothetical protein
LASAAEVELEPSPVVKTAYQAESAAPSEPEPAKPKLSWVKPWPGSLRGWGAITKTMD